MANLKIVIIINILIASPINIPVTSIAWAIGSSINSPVAWVASPINTPITSIAWAIVSSINSPVAWVIGCPIGSSIWAVGNPIGSPIGNPIGLIA